MAKTFTGTVTQMLGTWYIYNFKKSEKLLIFYIFFIKKAILLVALLMVKHQKMLLKPLKLEKLK